MENVRFYLGMVYTVRTYETPFLTRETKQNKTKNPSVLRKAGFQEALRMFAAFHVAFVAGCDNT